MTILTAAADAIGASDGKRTRANGRRSRESLLATALEVFAERGYEGTTLSEVARRVGMTKPGLLHHFGSKDALLLEVIQRRDDEQRWMLDVPWPTRLLAIAQANLDQPVLQRLMTTMSAEAVRPDHPAHAYMVARYRLITDAFARDLIHAGVPAERSDDLAREIFATLDGLHEHWLLDPERVDLVRVLTRYTERLSKSFDAFRDTPGAQSAKGDS